MTEFLYSRPECASFLIFLLFSIPIVISDIRTLGIPDVLNLALLLSLAAFRLVFCRGQFAYYLIIAVCAVLLFLAVRHLSSLGLGLGDVKYSPSCAFACGWLCFPAFLAASAMCALYFFAVKSRGRPEKELKAPFAPFMAAGTMLLCSIPIVQELLN